MFLITWLCLTNRRVIDVCDGRGTYASLVLPDLPTRCANTAVVTLAEIDVDFTEIEPPQDGRLANVKGEAYSSKSFLLPEHCRPSPALIPAPSPSPH